MPISQEGDLAEKKESLDIQELKSCFEEINQLSEKLIQSIDGQRPPGYENEPKSSYIHDVIKPGAVELKDKLQEILNGKKTSAEI